MRIKDLHFLPKLRDGWSHLYVEHCRIDRDDKAVAIHDADGTVRVPCANLALLMLGPGVSITHAAIPCPRARGGEPAEQYVKDLMNRMSPRTRG